MYIINQLKASGAIYLDNIQDGFDHYDYKVVTMNQEEAYESIKRLQIINETDNSYADFYYYRLDDEARKKVDAVLDVEEKEYLKVFSPKPEEIVFHLDDKLIGILIKLNYLEILFSSFYFTKEPCTMWGNYKHEYVVFHNKQ